VAEVLVLSDEAVRSLLHLDALAESLTLALTSLAEDKVSVPPRVAAFCPAGLLAAMPGYVPGLGLATKLVSIYPSNEEQGIPAHQALITVFDEATGTPTAIMGGTYITAIRTAMTAALAARAVARRESASLAIIGAGVQGDAHLVAFLHLLEPTDIRIASRRSARAAELARNYPNVVATLSFREAVAGADIVCCCTDARQAVLETEWVTPGTHVSSVGSGPELPLELLAGARVFVESRSVTLAPPVGAVELQGHDPASLTEIGAVLSGRAIGRTRDDEITVFKSTGHAVEDVAAAAVVLERARQLGVGTPMKITAGPPGPAGS
jgi:alanine dehydrogenase